MPRKRPPLHRHLSTIGIGPVFVHPPPHTLPPHPVVENDHKKIDGDGDGDDDRCMDKAGPSSPSNNSQSRNEIVTTTWEIVGDIKTAPQDFIVREIGWAPPSSSSAVQVEVGDDEQLGTNKYKTLPGWSRKIAGMDDHTPNHDEVSSSIDVEKGDAHHDVTSNKEFARQRRKDEINTTSVALAPDGMGKSSSKSTCELSKNLSYVVQTSDGTSSNNNGQQSSKDFISSEDQESPKDGLRRILIQCYSQSMCGGTGDEHEVAANAKLQELLDLQNLALKDLDLSQSTTTTSCVVKGQGQSSSTGSKSREVVLPSIKILQKQRDSGTNNLDDKDDWKLLHQYIRLAFPLLKTEVSSSGPSNKEASGESATGTNKKDEDGQNERVVSVLVDSTFFPIAKYLAKPSEDLLLLYEFRSKGPVPCLNLDGSRNRGYNSRNRKRKNVKVHKEQQEQTDKNVECSSACSKGGDSTTRGQVLLRLRPDLPRSERRAIHQTLASSRRRDFETSTKQNVPLDYANKDSEQTTAIAAQWSRNAILGSQKKRKRNNSDARCDVADTRKSDITAIFCVLRKEQCEHQVAINQMSRALRCRAGDIGLAGIKDMQAITYQFCTIRNVELKRLQHATNSLGNRVQLSKFVQVQGSEALLDRGKLLGSKLMI